jgi:hypothetical protein
MKLTLLFCYFLFLVCSVSFSQTNSTKNKLPLYNLYYLSKYIAAHETLDPAQSEEVYNVLMSIGEKNKIKFLNDEYNSSYDFQKSEKLPIGVFLNSRELVKNQIRLEIYNLLENYEFDLMKEKFKDHDTDKIKKLEIFFINNIKNQDISILNRRKILLDSLNIGFQTNKPEIINQYLNKYKNKITTDKDTITIDNINQKIDSISQLTKSFNENLAEYKKKIKEFADDYTKNKIFPSTKHIENFKVNYSKLNEIQISLNSTIQSSEQRSASAAYKLPSESDMIKAMAMFLAKRAQQETAIWFMDKIRENIKNPLIYEAFPETIKLIESLEDYKTPNFSVAWRYAIASDFIKMPTNLAGSAWVNNFIFENEPKKAELFKTAVTFSYNLNRLVAEKYNYRDIIRYFYTTPEYDITQNSEMKELLKNSITILYIVTNELFAIDEIGENKNFRLLSYEEISGMSEIQWRALGQLIKLKYGGKNDKFDSFFQDEFNQHQQPLSKWIGNLLLSLSQFDKVNKDFQETQEKKQDDPNYNFYNVWQNTIQIIDNLDYKRYLDSNIKTTKDNIEILKQTTSIYESIQNRNYSESIQKTLQIIDKVKLLEKANTHLQLYYNGTQFNHKKGQFYFATAGVQYFLIKEQNSSQNQNLYLVRHLKDTICTINNFKQISPFIKLMEPDKENGNYDLIKSLNSNFDPTIAEISESLKIKKETVRFMLKAFVLLEDAKEDGGEFDNEKLLTSLIREKINFNKNTQPNNEQTRIKRNYQDKLLKLTAFFGDVLVAKNAEELSSVIDSHALPPTSYKLKRRVSRSIDLNGYVGLQGSRMWTNGYTSLKTQYTAGITAPIGFAYTWSTLKYEKPDNFGFTVDIVDLGNIVNHYLVNSTSDYAKDVHFSEVFSPAFSFMYALRKTPFVVFASVKFLPLKASSTTNLDGTTTVINEKAFDATIFSAGVKIDIPLINLWSKEK